MFFTQPLSLFGNNHCFAYFHSFLPFIYLEWRCCMAKSISIK